MKRKFTLSEGKSIVSGIILYVLVVSLTVAACLLIEEKSYTINLQFLEDTAEQGASNAKLVFDDAKSAVALIADALEDKDVSSSETVQPYLQQEANALIASYAIQLPDGSLIFADNQKDVFTGIPEYEKLEDITLSHRFEDTSGNFYIAYRAPVLKNDSQVGILLGFIRLDDLTDFIDLEIFNGQCQMYIVDLENGDFLLDTWHNSLGNLNDSGFSGRETRGNGSVDDLMAGNSNYMIFRSTSANEDFYTWYLPLEGYDLSFQITITESIALANFIYIKKVIRTVCTVEILMCIVYFASLISENRKRLKRMQSELENNRLLNQIQWTLSSVYENPYLINDALQALTLKFQGCKAIFATVSLEHVIQNLYSYPVLDEKKRSCILGQNLQDAFPALYEKLAKNEDAVLFEKQDLTCLLECLHMEQLAVENAVSASVFDNNHTLQGVLILMDVQDAHRAKHLLPSLTSAFESAMQAIHSYSVIHQMGTVETLTGIKNRNAYENELSGYAVYGTKLCCAYCDVNGLHELNNTQGHNAGDKMLKTVASQLVKQFGDAYCYRIGGDEFVALGVDMTSETLEARVSALKEELAKDNYYVSVGYAFRQSSQTVSQMIVEAEKKMYIEKEKFYSNSNSDRRSGRQQNASVDRMLLEKEDAKNFFNAISNAYMAAYIVNLDTDDARALFKPVFFQRLLEEYDYHFRSTIREYARIFVKNKDFYQLIDLCDYAKLHDQLSQGKEVCRNFEKTDETKVHVRIIPMDNYSTARKNTLWIFEKATAYNNVH